MAGFGRAGDWFAFHALAEEGEDPIRPDLVTFAKGVNSGYVPVGGVLISEAIAATFDDRVFPGGLTYSGHPLAMASIVASITAMHQEGILDNADRIGREVLGPGLARLAEKHPMIGETRGLGVFWALDLVADPATREPLAPARVADLKSALLSRGVLPFTADNRIHLVPPCIITAEEAAHGIAVVDEVLTAASTQ